MTKHTNLQDEFLSILCKEQMPLSIFLINGIKLHGVIEQFDEHIIFLKSTITQMVFKHAISTVVPSQPITLPAEKPKK